MRRLTWENEDVDSRTVVGVILAGSVAVFFALFVLIYRGRREREAFRARFEDRRAHKHGTEPRE